MGTFSEQANHPEGAQASGEPSPAGKSAGLAFDAVYEGYLSFVWRASRRLGVDPADSDDVVQEVFFVVHRRLQEFEGRASLKTWLFRIVLHVVRHYQRSRLRKPGHRPASSLRELDEMRDDQSHGPGASAERAEAVRTLDRLLAELDSEKREVFVLAEIEGMTAAEISEVLEVNPNTVYSRLRGARQEFERALARFQARELGRDS